MEQNNNLEVKGQHLKKVLAFYFSSIPRQADIAVSRRSQIPPYNVYDI